MTGKRIGEQALIGGQWLAEHQNPDGSWRGMDDPKVDAFYKAIWALMETGRPAAAHRAVNYVKQRLFTAEGDFLPREYPAHTSLHYLYANSYLIMGSVMAGRYDVAVPAVRFLLTQQDAVHGGFYSRFTAPGAKEMSDTISISAAGLACLSSGHVEAACRAADCLAYIVNLQPAPDDRFYTSLKADGQLLTDIKDEGETLFRVIDSKREDQCWFAMGLPFAFLVRLADALDDARYRDLSRWFFDFQRRCVDPWDCSSSGKAGWGCAMLYRITGETSYRDISLHIAENIVSRQRPAGNWSWETEDAEKGGQPALTNADMDLTAEFTLWLSLISTNILARDSSQLPDVRVGNGNCRLSPQGKWWEKLFTRR